MMSNARATAFLLTLVWAAPAAPAENAAAARVLSDVARLASDAWQGRRAGTAQSDQAAAWLADEFRRIGLQPGGPKGSFFQEFTFIDGVSLGKKNALRANVAGQTRSFEAGTDFRPLAFSAHAAAMGEVVFAGYGIVAKDLVYDDYDGVDAKGRVVLVLRYGPDGDDPQSKWAAFTGLRFKASAARDKGASALLVVSGPRTKGAADELVPLRSDASLSSAAMPAFSVKRSVAEALFAASGTTLDAAQARLDDGKKPAPLALSRVSLDAYADVTPNRARSRNVIGLLPAPGAAAAVVVGAHYDHLGTGMSGSLDPAPDRKVHHGADDNASGVAGLLELARRMSRNKDGLRRSIVFAGFGAEEEGTLGSAHFVKEPTLPLDQVDAMVNMDMIGRLRDDALDVHGVGTSPVWKPLIEEANRSVGLKLRLREGGYGPSDHNAFYAAGKPVFFVFTGSHSDYHRPSDTADKINSSGIVKILDLVEPVLRGVAGTPGPIPFTRVAADKEESAASTRGVRVWVGGVPDYSDEGAGVKFSGVSPGSPAEKGGVQAGDVLVKFGAKEIGNIYDYTFALGEFKPGDRVAIVVKRKGEAVTLDLVLAARPSAVR